MDRDLTVVGFHGVSTLLERRPGDVRTVCLRQGNRGGRVDALAARCRELGVPLRRVADAELEKLAAGSAHQGVAAQVSAPRARSERELRAALEKGGAAPLYLVLDGVQDPRNLGACLRTADAAGCAGVIVPGRRAAGLTPAAVKTSSAAAFFVPVYQVANLARSLRMLRAAGLWLYGLDQRGGHSLYSADLTGPAAFLLGAEGGGLRRLTREHCDVLLQVPMAGTVESLNVSVAAAVSLYEAVRQRGAARS